MRREAPPRPLPVGGRGLTVLLLLVAGLLAARSLGLFATPTAAGRGGQVFSLAFFRSALSPTLTSQDPTLPAGASLLPQLLEAVHATVVFAAAALGLALGAGFLLGFLGSTAWWAGDAATGRGRRAFRSAVYGAVRVLIALLRSVHELIWAVVFLAALGRSDLAAVVALALPYCGTVAKVFSEIVDEAPRGPALALRAAGARPAAVFAFGLLPRALPDLAAYAFYQFECLLRSAAVLGFFGFPTLGYHLAASFENLYYREVWTWLYALVALVVLTEWWSAALRRRWVA